MTQIRSRKHSVNRYLATVAAVAIPAMPLVAHAQAAEEKTLKEVTVTATVDKYKRESVNPKNTQALVDTPQTISIIGKEIIEEQGATSLMEALRNTPGITMQMGENGNSSTGDTFQMRGFDAASSLFVDGVRDIGAVSRDTYNTEQIEVAKGPAGADTGRGASAGYINLVTKLPHQETSSSAGVRWTTEDGKRAVIDYNQKLGDTTALRLNLMAQDNPTPGRDVVKKSGFGIAPSLAFGLGMSTRFYLFGQHHKEDNIPDGGASTVGLDGYYNSNSFLNDAPAISSELFYGNKNDFEETEQNSISGKIEHDFNNGFIVTNLSRYTHTNFDRIVSGIFNATAPSADTSTWTMPILRQRVGRENTTLTNQTNLSGNFATGGLDHTFAAGVEVIYEEQKTDSFYGIAAADRPQQSLYNPDHSLTMPTPAWNGGYAKGKTTTLAAYFIDTVRINDQWSINGSVRVDSYDTEYVSVAPNTSNVLVANSIEGQDTIASWKVGAVYKPVPNGTLYAAFANSKTPPGSANFSLSTSATSTANPNADPQETENLEAGVKWEFMEGKLLLTGAYYSTTHQNELFTTDTDGVTYQGGERTVKGIELGAVGRISDNWSISAGIQTLDTEVTEGSTGNNTEGAAARWSPDVTGTVWTTYKNAFVPGLTIGGGARYMGEQKRVVNPATDLSTQNMPLISSYWVVDAMASYDVSPAVAVQLNVYNLFDEEYIEKLNNGGARYIPGTPRWTSLSLNFKF